MPAKQQRTTMRNSLDTLDVNSRTNAKKLPTASPSSYAFAPRWMAKGNGQGSSIPLTSPMSSRPTSPTDANEDSFPSLAGALDDGKKKRSVWADANAVRKKVLSPSGESSCEDPFAGMNSLVDYQAEIERLKALVPKVEKRRSAAAARPKSTGTDLKAASSQRSSWNNPPSRSTQQRPSSVMSAKSSPRRTGAASSPTLSDTQLVSSTAELPSAAHADMISASRSTSSVSSEQISSADVSQVSSVTSEDEKLEAAGFSPKVAAASHANTTATKSDESTKSVITEEEKARFLEFMRSWTGGWQGWDRNESSAESVKKTGSLWANASPWESKRRSLQEPSTTKRTDTLAITMPTLRQGHPFVSQSEPTSPFSNDFQEAQWPFIAIDGGVANVAHQPQRSLHRPGSASAIPYYRDDLLARQWSQQQYLGQQQFVPTNNNDQQRRGISRVEGRGGAPFGVFVM